MPTAKPSNSTISNRTQKASNEYSCDFAASLTKGSKNPAFHLTHKFPVIVGLRCKINAVYAWKPQ